MSGQTSIKQNGTIFGCHGGNCQSVNIIYIASCKLCLLKKKYVGKTVTELRKRVSNHRNMFKTFRSDRNTEISDKEALTAHARSYHQLQTVTEFNNCYVWDVYRKLSNPDMPLTEEQRVINQLNTIYPIGLNITNPIGLNNYLIDRL